MRFASNLLKTCKSRGAGLHLTYPRDKRAAMAKAGTLQLSMVPLSELDSNSCTDSPQQGGSGGARGLPPPGEQTQHDDRLQPLTAISDAAVAHQSAINLAARPSASPSRGRVGPGAPPARTAGPSSKAPGLSSSSGKAPAGLEPVISRGGDGAAPGGPRQASSELGKPGAERLHAVGRLHAPKRD